MSDCLGRSDLKGLPPSDTVQYIGEISKPAGKVIISYFGRSKEEIAKVMIAFRSHDTIRTKGWNAIPSFGPGNHFPYTPYPKEDLHIVPSVLRDYEQLRLDLIHHPKIKSLRASVPVVFTGHGIGGVLATYAALELHYLYQFWALELITINSPRPGKQGLVDLVHHVIPKITRWVQEDDIIPQIPSYDLGYRHTRGETWYYQNTIRCCEETENIKCSRRLTKLALIATWPVHFRLADMSPPMFQTSFCDTISKSS
jgi:hypothetical protein